MENRGIWRIEARLWKLQKARPDLKRELSVLSGPVFRKFVDGAKQTARGLIVYYSPLIGALDPAVDIWIVSAY